MEIEQAKQIAKKVKVQWDKTNFLEKEIKKESKVSLFVGRRKAIMEFSGDKAILRKATVDQKYSMYVSGKDSVPITRTSKNHFMVPFSNLLYKNYTNTDSIVARIPLVDKGLENVIGKALGQLFPTETGLPDVKKLAKFTDKAIKQWSKTNLLEIALEKHSSLEFLANERTITIKIKETELQLIGWGGTPTRDKEYRYRDGGTKIEKSWNGDSFWVGQTPKDNYRKYFKKNLSDAITFAIENVIAPQCSTRKLDLALDVRPWSKPRPHDSDPLFAAAEIWKNNNVQDVYAYNWGENPVFCFMPAKRNEGILFEIDEEYDYGEDASGRYVKTALKEISVKQAYRFLVPQSLEKIYNLEYKKLKQPTHCCTSFKALVVQCARDDPSEWEGSFMYNATFLHEINEFDKNLKDEMKWLLGKWNFIDSNKTVSEELIFEGIIALPGGNAEKMNFAAVFVREENGQLGETFIKPISSKGSVVEADKYKHTNDSKGVGLSERVMMQKMVSKDLQERMKINLEKVRKACSTRVYSKKVLDLLGD